MYPNQQPYGMQQQQQQYGQPMQQQGFQQQPMMQQQPTMYQQQPMMQQQPTMYQQQPMMQQRPMQMQQQPMMQQQPTMYQQQPMQQQSTFYTSSMGQPMQMQQPMMQQRPMQQGMMQQQPMMMQQPTMYQQQPMQMQQGGMMIQQQQQQGQVNQYNQKQNSLNNQYLTIDTSVKGLIEQLKGLSLKENTLQQQQRQMILQQNTGQGIQFGSQFGQQVQMVQSQLMQTQQQRSNLTGQVTNYQKQAMTLYAQQQNLNITRTNLGGNSNMNLAQPHPGLLQQPNFTVQLQQLNRTSTMQQQPTMYGQQQQIPNRPPPSYGQEQKVQYGQQQQQRQQTQYSQKSGSSGKAHEQPLPDARGSITSPTSYTERDAMEDAKDLRRAMKGMGCNTAKVAEIIGGRTNAQRQMIIREYVGVDQALGGKGRSRDLIKDLISELRGNTEKLAVALCQESGVYDAFLMKRAMDGAGFNTDLLVEVLCTRTNAQIRAMMDGWQRTGSKRDLPTRVQEETRKMMGKNNFNELCMVLMRANRPANTPVDRTAVLQDAERLNRLINTGKSSEAKRGFVEVFTQRSWVHIAALTMEFQNISKKFGMDRAIKKAFGEGSDTSKALRTIADFAAQPYDYWAKKLVESMKGMGTKDQMLIRLVVTRAEVDLANIQQVFAQRYGKGKTLKNWIESDTSGDYKKLLLRCCGY